MNNKPPYLSIIIPCFNESENLRRGVLKEVYSFLEKQKFTWELIISDDESTDDSWSLVEKFIAKQQAPLIFGKNNVVHLKNKHGGKPFAVRAGLEKAKGEWVLFTDMDQATPMGEFKKLQPFFNNHDVVIGSRGIFRKNFPLYRKLASFIFLNFRRFLLLPNIKDTQCGFKAFKRKVALDLFPKLQVFQVKIKVYGWRVSAYDVELLFLGQKAGYKIAEVPVVWKDVDIAKGKQRNFLKESKEMFKEILRVRLNDLKGLYG